MKYNIIQTKYYLLILSENEINNPCYLYEDEAGNIHKIIAELPINGASYSNDIPTLPPLNNENYPIAFECEIEINKITGKQIKKIIIDSKGRTQLVGKYIF